MPRKYQKGPRKDNDLRRLIDTCHTLDTTRASDESELFSQYQMAVEKFASKYHQSIAEVEQTVLNAVVI